MRHLVDHKKFGRTSPHRKALFRNLVVALVRHGRIETTLAKAKELRRLADRVVTWGKEGSIAARRHARAACPDRAALTKLFNELAPRFKSRQGGYTRILKMQYRTGDQAPMALVEYLDNPLPQPKKNSKKEKAKKS